MLTIRVRVPADRARSAVVQVPGRPAATGLACASADAALAKRHGNADCDPMRPWGHPPPGRYRFIASGPLPEDCHAEYGSHMLVFQPESGAALDAESFGRLLLPVYAGPPARDGRLRRTQGGVRVEQSLLALLLHAVTTDTEVLLEIGTQQPPAWWQFWRGAETGEPLAADPPSFSAPPLDETSLAQALAAGKRRALVEPTEAIDDDRHWNRDRERSSGSTSGVDPPFTGRGGEFGGGGASGSWDAPRGVDSAGRITAAAAGITAAAAGVVAAAAVVDALAAKQDDPAPSDASTGGSVDGGTGGSTDGGADGAAEAGAGTDSATAY